jgi:hypothetical protein
MNLLGRMLHDLLHFLMIVNAGASIVIWAMAVRESLGMVSNAPEWRGWLTLRRPLASELSEPYLAHRRQMMRFLFAFCVLLVVEVLLILLNNLFFRNSS